MTRRTGAGKAYTQSDVVQVFKISSRSWAPKHYLRITSYSISTTLIVVLLCSLVICLHRDAASVRQHLMYKKRVAHLKFLTYAVASLSYFLAFLMP